MLKVLLITFIFSLSFLPCKSQTNPFSDSNKMTAQTFDFSNFDKISILDLDGVIKIEVGKAYSVKAQIKEKYVSILEVKEVGKELVLVFKYTKDNNKYIENPNIKVKITCPTLTSLDKIGNANVFVSIPRQDSFSMTNQGNGSSILKGVVKQLDLKNDGNGNMDAKNIVAESVYLKSFGNGNIIINAKEKAEVERNGNGNVKQIGKAMITEPKQ